METRFTGLGRGESIVETVAASIDPVTTDQMRRHLCLPTDDQSTEEDIDSHIKAATRYGQKTLGAQFIQATFEYKLKWFPGGTFLIPLSPLVSISSITYVDTNGDTQTLATSVYEVDAAARPGRVGLQEGQVWPATQTGLAKVTITFVAGYGTARTDLPYTLTHAIKMLAAHLFNFREPIVEGSVSEVPLGLRTLFRIEGHGHLF